MRTHEHHKVNRVNLAAAVATHTMGTASVHTIRNDIIGGAIINPPSAIIERTANLLTNQLGINAISYCTHSSSWYDSNYWDTPMLSAQTT